MSNPGKLPKVFYTGLTEEGFAPIRYLRLYNMRHWLVNGIYTFDELCENEAEKSEVPKEISAEKLIDVEKLTALEQKVYDLDDKSYC